MTALKRLAMTSMMMSGVLADPQDRFSTDSPNYIKDRIKAIQQHFRQWGDEHSLHRLNEQSCGVAIYQVANSDGKSSFEGGLAYLAHEHQQHHVFDGVLNVPVDQLKLKTPFIADYPFILEGYLENHFCDEAHLYMNLPNKGEFKEKVEKLEDAQRKEVEDAEQSVTAEAEKEEAKSKATETAIEKNVQAYFYKSAIFQKALPAVLRNRAFKKLVVHRVVGFTHAGWNGLAEEPRTSIVKTELYSEDLTNIFKKVHIMEPVEFDLEEYRKDQKIQICVTDPDHDACSDVNNKDWHTLAFITDGVHKPNLPYKTKGITNFIDSMLCGLAEEYQNALRSPDTGKGAASFKAIWQESQKKSRGQPYKKFVEGSSIHTDLTHVAAQEEWPSVVSSVAKRVKMGMCHADSASTYEKYVVGRDVSRLLGLLALGIPFLMYR